MRAAMIALTLIIGPAVRANVFMHCGPSKGESCLFKDRLWNLERVCVA